MIPVSIRTFIYLFIFIHRICDGENRSNRLMCLFLKESFNSNNLSISWSIYYLRTFKLIHITVKMMKKTASRLGQLKKSNRLSDKKFPIEIKITLSERNFAHNKIPQQMKLKIANCFFSMWFKRFFPLHFKVFLFVVLFGTYSFLICLLILFRFVFQTFYLH